MNYTQISLNLSAETLFMAVSLVDKVLSRIIISRTKFQLLGLACLFVASKYEEIKLVSPNKFISNCSVAYSLLDLLAMES